MTAEFLGAVERLVVVGGGYGLLAIWFALNASRSRHGLRIAFALMCVGWMLNSSVVLANQGMPVSSAALASAHVHAAALTPGALYGHIPLDEKTRLAIASDVIPIPPLHRVVSPGDIVILSGFAMIVAAGMRLNTRKERAARGRIHRVG